MTLSEPATGATAPTLGDAVAGPAALTVAERLKTLALNTYVVESRPRPGSTRAPPLLHNLQRLHVHDCTRPRQLSTRIHSRTHFMDPSAVLLLSPPRSPERLHSEPSESFQPRTEHFQVGRVECIRQKAHRWEHERFFELRQALERGDRRQAACPYVP